MQEDFDVEIAKINHRLQKIEEEKAEIKKELQDLRDNPHKHEELCKTCGGTGTISGFFGDKMCATCFGAGYYDYGCQRAQSVSWLTNTYPRKLSYEKCKYIEEKRKFEFLKFAQVRAATTPDAELSGMIHLTREEFEEWTKKTECSDITLHSGF